jgi:hypothetical protein
LDTATPLHNKISSATINLQNSEGADSFRTVWGKHGLAMEKGAA